LICTEALKRLVGFDLATYSNCLFWFRDGGLLLVDRTNLWQNLKNATDCTSFFKKNNFLGYFSYTRIM
jgi:hypothetical protein